ncbi:hypothetical protein P5E37_28205 [Vibrio parahaemolyticus]|nr:hypothetical protein [Vibrio parahaemolyticus]
MNSLVLCNALWELPTYRRHCEVSERGLAEELSQLESEMDQRISVLSEYEQDYFFRDVNDHWIETAETLPRLQWYSQLMTVYGYFEKLLNDLCNEQRDSKKLVLTLKDLHGQGIERSRNYLVKLVGLEKSFTTNEWQRIKLIGSLRNSVAHRDGYVDFEPSNPKSTYSKLSKISGVELRQETQDQEEAQIFFSEQVIIETLELFDTFIRNLDSELSNG